MNRARAIRQNGVAVNASRHQWRQRAIVWRSTLATSESRAKRASVAPCFRMAISTTIAATWTRRPRKRSDAGVSRPRQPSTAQQKLKRWSCSGPSLQPRPLGLRLNLAECSAPSQCRHRPARAASARSASKASSSSWNLASASSVAYKEAILLSLRPDPDGQARTQRSLPPSLLVFLEDEEPVKLRSERSAQQINKGVLIGLVVGECHLVGSDFLDG